ncbi:NB-ARC domain-containing protein [Actinacidiphila alni]|uniref:NB-ARC domain-containing protein n=1 Tax=Actinacidiphila alni TaxID=380248 RepID=A0A1I2EFA2_9ACTN|nr:tetratricopeptide repeat protein [Actinacidiphila alni]SFE91399.1 NB-ARC domain-containing protein [Actinacidiphila alni]
MDAESRRASHPAHSDHHNAISGGVLHGGVVQAGSVGDIHWHAAPAAPVPVELPVPRQLIAGPRRLVGRARDLAALDALLLDTGRDGPLVAVVNGPAGVGKTALVSYWLRGKADDFPDGQLYADLRGYAPEGPAEPSEVLGMFLRAFGVTSVPSGLAETAALWRSVTAGRRLILMLDNVVSAAQVRPLLPAAPDVVVAVTSRRRLTGLGLEGAAFRPLGFLDADASAEILRQRLGAGRVAAEPAAARRVIERCGGLALAVCVAAARMAARPGQPLAVTAEALDRGAERLTVLRAGEGIAVQSALDASYRFLPEDAAALYRLLGVLPFADFPPELAAAACGPAPDGAVRRIDALAEVSLLEQTDDGPEHYRFHDLVRLHARGLAETVDPVPVRRAAVRRALEWCLATATAAEALILPSHRTLDRDYEFPPVTPTGDAFAGEQDALGWLGREQSRLMIALRAAVDAGWDGLAWQLTDAMCPLFLRLRPYDAWVEAHRIGLDAARRAAHVEGEMRMLTSGGTGLRNAGRPEEAVGWFGQALALARRHGNRRMEAQALHGLGQSHHLAGRPTEAVRWFTEALAIREEIGYARGAALSRLSLGDVALSAGRPGDAVRELGRARAELLAASDTYDAARSMALLGRAHGEEGRTDLAERCLRQAAEEFRTAGSVHWEARSYELLGLVHRRSDRPDDARQAFERSLRLYEGVGAPDVVRLEGHLAPDGHPEAGTAPMTDGPDAPDTPPPGPRAS